MSFAITHLRILYYTHSDICQPTLRYSTGCEIAASKSLPPSSCASNTTSIPNIVIRHDLLRRSLHPLTTNPPTTPQNRPPNKPPPPPSPPRLRRPSNPHPPSPSTNRRTPHRSNRINSRLSCRRRRRNSPNTSSNSIRPRPAQSARHITLHRRSHSRHLRRALRPVSSGRPARRAVSRLYRLAFRTGRRASLRPAGRFHFAAMFWRVSRHCRRAYTNRASFVGWDFVRWCGTGCGFADFGRGGRVVERIVGHWRRDGQRAGAGVVGRVSADDCAGDGYAGDGAAVCARGFCAREVGTG